MVFTPFSSNVRTSASVCSRSRVSIEELDLGRLDRGGAEDALVLDLDDVAAAPRRSAAATLARLPETSGIVTRRRTSRASRTSPRISTEASTRLSMLPPEIGRPTRLAGEALRMLEQRGQRRGAGAFGDRLLDLDQRDDRALDGLLLDHQHVLDQSFG